MSLIATASTLSGLQMMSLLAASSTLNLISTANPQALTRELELMDRFVHGTLPEQFASVDNLNQLYLRQHRHGGHEGMRWTRDTKASLVTRVVEKNSYAEFLQRDPAGKLEFRLPRVIPYPLFLRFPDHGDQASIIPIRREPKRRFNYKAYFKLADLLSEVDYLAATEMSPVQATQATTRFASLTKSHVGDDYMIINGLTVALSGLHAGESYVLGHYEGLSALPNSAVKLSHVQLLSPEEIAIRQRPKPVPLIPIVTELTFSPKRDPEFSPLKITLQRQGRDCPVIVERYSPTEACCELDGKLKHEVTHILSRTTRDPNSILILIMRTLDGVAVASSSNLILRGRTGLSLRGEGTLKVDESHGTGIQQVGLGFLMARLRYLKENGAWNRRETLISSILPKVFRRYQLDAGLIDAEEYRESYLDLNVDSISGTDAERFLAANPLEIEAV